MKNIVYIVLSASENLFQVCGISSDPDSKVAQRNVGYFKGKLERTTKKAKKPKILRNRFEKICSSMKPKVFYIILYIVNYFITLNLKLHYWDQTRLRYMH